MVIEIVAGATIEVTESRPSIEIVAGPVGPNPSDSFGLGFKLAESVGVPTDSVAYAASLTQAETNAAPSDTVQTGLTYAETANAPTDARTSTGNFWLSGSAGAGVTNPGNADGANDAANASVKTALAGAETVTLTSAVGVGVPAATPVTAATYRGWFNAPTSAVSTVKVTLRSTTAAFADVVMLDVTFALVAHADGSFVFDIFAAGVNTLAKIQSCQVLHSVTDSVPGGGTTLLVNAGRIELTNIV